MVLMLRVLGRGRYYEYSIIGEDIFACPSQRLHREDSGELSRLSTMAARPEYRS